MADTSKETLRDTQVDGSLLYSQLLLERIDQIIGQAPEGLRAQMEMLAAEAWEDYIDSLHDVLDTIGAILKAQTQELPALEKEGEVPHWPELSYSLWVPRVDADPFGPDLGVEVLEITREEDKITAVVKSEGLTTRELINDIEYHFPFEVGETIKLKQNDIVELREELNGQKFVRKFRFDAYFPRLVNIDAFDDPGL